MYRHARPLLGVLAALVPLACDEQESGPARTADAVSDPASRDGPACPELPPDRPDPAAAVRAETVAEGLVVPWALGFAPDGRIFVTERPGRIRVIESGRLRAEPWAELDVHAEGEAGLLGLAVAPDFDRSGHVFVAGVFRTGPEIDLIRRNRPGFRLVRASHEAEPSPSQAPAGGGAQTRLELRVYRLTDREGRGAEPVVIVEGIAASRLHAGGALAFGPDGLLYLSAGDALQPELAQDTVALPGKLLRYTAEGGIPDDNPFQRSAVLAVGLRNVQGLAWHPETEDLFAADHGPTALPREREASGRDELNRITPRGNYGWPVVAGIDDDPRFIAPLSEWTPAIAPAGLAVYDGDALPWFGNVFVGALRGEQLRRVVLAEDPDVDSGWRLLCEEPLFTSEYGRIRAAAMGPDGSLYFTTSNRDGRGRPTARDDRVLRVLPAEKAGELAEEDGEASAGVPAGARVDGRAEADARAPAAGVAPGTP